jgi:hypothetical protein
VFQKIETHCLLQELIWKIPLISLVHAKKQPEPAKDSNLTRSEVSILVELKLTDITEQGERHRKKGSILVELPLAAITEAERKGRIEVTRLL